MNAKARILGTALTAVVLMTGQAVAAEKCDPTKLVESGFLLRRDRIASCYEGNRSKKPGEACPWWSLTRALR